MGTEAIDADFFRRNARDNDPVNARGRVAGLAGACLTGLKFAVAHQLAIPKLQALPVLRVRIPISTSKQQIDLVQPRPLLQAKFVE
jgi:hypothetical protein